MRSHSKLGRIKERGFSSAIATGSKYATGRSLARIIAFPTPYQWQGQGEFYREARSQADTEQGMVAIHHVLTLLPHP